MGKKFGELFTPQEIAQIANASLEWYLGDLHGKTPMQVAHGRINEAKSALREAERLLKEALAYRQEVLKMPYAKRHKVYDYPQYATPFRQALMEKPLLRSSGLE